MTNMKEINIPIYQGDNFISFPATSTDNFYQILTYSGTIDNITEFKEFDPILKIWKLVNYNRYIEKGKGYYISSKLDGFIKYNGTEYILILDELKYMLVPSEWNFVGTGTNTIILPSWCFAYDPFLNKVNQLESTKAYWINNSYCIKPVIGASSVIAAVGTVGTILFTIYLLKEFKIIK